MADVSGPVERGLLGRVLTFSNDAEIEVLRCWTLDVDESALDGAERTPLAAVGDVHWCSSLTALDCTGFAQLAIVGDNWLHGCTSLTSLDCTGLTQLAAVGDNWLQGCSSLTSLDCTGLTQLATVGDNWLRDCTSLAAMD